MNGKFITIEGLEGAGKSNAVRVVQACLNEAKIEAVLTREPGGTPIAEALRTLWKEGIDDEHTTDNTELLMMYAARCQLVETVIQPALRAGKWVIGDRHDLSSQAYQGGGRGLQTQVAALKALMLPDFEPDLTLYLDVAPEIGLARARGRGALDRIEQQNIAFFERTRAAYLSLAASQHNVVVIDANQPIEQVSAAIREAVVRFLNAVR